VDWHPFPWALSGQGVLSDNPGVRGVVLRQCAVLDNLLEELAPLHHTDMAKASEAVEIVVPPSMLDAVRDQLGSDHERHLVHVDGDVHRLDVRLCACLDEPGVLCNGTVNWTRLIAKFLTDLDPATLSTEVHGDGQDFKAFDKFAVGGASITSPFFSSEKLTAGNFVGYLDSVTLSEKHTVPSGHTAAGTLYALAHEVLTALLVDGVDMSSLTAEELEALVRGSLIFQATRIHSNAFSHSLCPFSSSPFPSHNTQNRHNLMVMLERLRATPNPKFFSRDVKRIAFGEGKAQFTTHFADVWLAEHEDVDTGKDMDNCVFWRQHSAEFLKVGELEVNRSVLSSRRAYWAKKALDDQKAELSDEQVEGVAALAHDRFMKHALERYLTDLELAEYGPESPLVQKFWESTSKRWVPGDSSTDSTILAMNELLPAAEAAAQETDVATIIPKLLTTMTSQMSKSRVSRAVGESPERFSDPNILLEQLRSIKATGQPYVRRRFDPGTQLKLIEGRSKCILEQVSELLASEGGVERLREVLCGENSTLKTACGWLVREFKGVAEFVALKLCGALQFGGLLLGSDDCPRIGWKEGCSTSIRCLVHAYISGNPDFPTWLKNDKLDEKGVNYVTQFDLMRILRKYQATWAPRAQSAWLERKAGDASLSRWDHAVGVGFVPTPTILAVEARFCEVGCRLLRAIAFTDDSEVDYPKGEFKWDGRQKDLSNVKLLYADEFGSIVRANVSLRPGDVAVIETDVEAEASVASPIAAAALVAEVSASTDPPLQPLPDGACLTVGTLACILEEDGTLCLDRSIAALEDDRPQDLPNQDSNQDEEMTEIEEVVEPQAPSPTLHEAVGEDEEMFTDEQIQAGGMQFDDDAGMALSPVDAEALARRIAEAPVSTTALEVLSFGGAKLDSTSGYVGISGAYKELARLIHPDKLPGSVYANAAFQRINQAKNELLPPTQPPAPRPGEIKRP